MDRLDKILLTLFESLLVSSEKTKTKQQKPNLFLVNHVHSVLKQ